MQKGFTVIQCVLIARILLDIVSLSGFLPGYTFCSYSDFDSVSNVKTQVTNTNTHVLCNFWLTGFLYLPHIFDMFKDVKCG